MATALWVEWLVLGLSAGIHWLPQMVLWVGWLVLGLSAGSFDLSAHWVKLTPYLEATSA
ncbi:MAG: hypothetical protein ND866_18760 [Pyrinomonadaceae bacterium]|nr:hypothetical protein [Pyrinomonadaceae bacterium]